MKLHLPLFTRVLVLSKFAITTALLHGLLSNARGNELLNNVGVVRNSPQLIAESSNIPSTLSDGMRIENLSLINGENTSFGIEGGAEVYIIGNTYGERASFSLGASSKLYFLADETGVSHMNVGTFSNGGGGNDFNREIIVGSGVNMSALSFTNGWGMRALTVDGSLELEGTLTLNSGGERVGNIIDTNVITGMGSISAKTLYIENWSDYNKISVRYLTITGNSGFYRNTIISGGAIALHGNVEQGGHSSWGERFTSDKLLSIESGWLILGDELNDKITLGGVVHLSDGTLTINGTAINYGKFEQSGGILDIYGSFSFADSIIANENAYIMINDEAFIEREDKLRISKLGLCETELQGSSITANSISGVNAEHRGRIHGARIDLLEGGDFFVQNLVLVESFLTSRAPVTAVLDDVTAELIMDVNTMWNGSVQLLSGTTLAQSGNSGVTLTLSDDASVLMLEATTFDSLTLSGSSLVLELAGMTLEMFDNAELIAVSFTSGTGYASFDKSLAVTLSVDGINYERGYTMESDDTPTTMYFRGGKKAAPTPEPATSSLFLLALATLTARRRRLDCNGCTM